MHSRHCFLEAELKALYLKASLTGMDTEDCELGKESHIALLDDCLSARSVTCNYIERDTRGKYRKRQLSDRIEL